MSGFYGCCQQACPDLNAGDPLRGRGWDLPSTYREMEPVIPHGQSSGGTQPCSVRVTSLPSCPAARPILCRGPMELAMLSTHIHGQRCWGLKGNCRQEEEEEEEGREGAALPLRTAAAHCSRRQSPILPGSYGSLRDTAPHRRWAQPGVGPLALAAGRYKGCHPLGCVPRLVCAGAAEQPSPL